MSTNWTAFRNQFPALEDTVYLNTAGGGVMARSVAEVGKSYFDEASAYGDAYWGEWLLRSEKDRHFVAKFVGAEPTSTAFLQNASLGLNIVARSFEEPVSVLALRPEFPSCTTPFIRAGHHISFIETGTDGYVDAEMLESAIQLNKSQVFVLSSVQFANGFRADLAALGAVCKAHNVIFVVDATQSIGAFEINVKTDCIDALVFSGYKWALAGYGNAVLATGPHWNLDHPPLIGWRSAIRAYDLENDRLDLHASGIGHEMGHPPFPSIFVLAEALRVLHSKGVASISERILSLAAILRTSLKEKGVAIRSYSHPNHYSGIVLAEMPDADMKKQRLQDAGIWVSARQGGLRISLHAYNSEEDISRFIEAL